MCDKEQKILDHINLFYNALVQQIVFTNPVPLTDPPRVIKRSLLNFFSPYSTIHIAKTANKNYHDINTNFARAKNDEHRLSHRQNKLSSTYQSLSNAQKMLAREELYKAFHLFLLEQSLKFKAHLQHLQSKIHISKAFKLAFQPLHTPNY